MGDRVGVTGPLAGRTALITGAGRGIGAAAAERLHALGANLALADLDPEPVAAIARGLGDRARAFETDVTDAGALDRTVHEAVARFGGLDIVIANAGIGQVGALASAQPGEIERTLEVNLLGTWHTDRAALAELIRSRGYLLNVASLAAATHTAANGAYAASKAGVEALTDALRVELAGAGVGVGCAYFGYIETDLQRGSVSHPAIESIQAMMPRFARRAAPGPWRSMRSRTPFWHARRERGRPGTSARYCSRAACSSHCPSGGPSATAR